MFYAMTMEQRQIRFKELVLLLFANLTSDGRQRFGDWIIGSDFVFLTDD